ncbi:MAG: isopentenyl-diphosphate delta-isomerase [Bacteroidota bacterium]
MNQSEDPLHLVSNSSEDMDPTAVSRKRDHIELAFQSQVEEGKLDRRFYYEPLLSGHPEQGSTPAFTFLNKTMHTPLWVSSMTGGTEMARTINYNLARACGEFGMGLGLGSCRSLLYSDDYFNDFNVRPILGDEVPLYANLGIAQLEQLVQENKLDLVMKLVEKLQADGLIIHINPLQEWLQPEGDHFQRSPIETLYTFLDQAPNLSIIVKEVGQGMGYESLKALFQLPIAAVEFAANGGTNFAKLELLRNSPLKQAVYSHLSLVGHSAEDMVDMTNKIAHELGDQMLCKEVIISGGIKNFLDGFYLINKLSISCVYGQASGFLKHARGTYEELHPYVEAQVEGLKLAKAFLRLKS